MYDVSGAASDRNCVVLSDIHIDIMDYIQPASCTDTEFRQMWAEFEWENKASLGTGKFFGNNSYINWCSVIRNLWNLCVLCQHRLPSTPTSQNWMSISNTSLGPPIWSAWPQRRYITRRQSVCLSIEQLTWLFFCIRLFLASVALWRQTCTPALYLGKMPLQMSALRSPSTWVPMPQSTVTFASVPRAR